MPDPKTELESIANDLRALRNRIESANQPFNSLLGQAALDIAGATGAVLTVASRQPTAQHFAAR